VKYWLRRNEKEEKTKPTHMKFLSLLLTASLGERIGNENVFYCKMKLWQNKRNVI
jgi:hypothetical protein